MSWAYDATPQGLDWFDVLAAWRELADVYTWVGGSTGWSKSELTEKVQRAIQTIVEILDLRPDVFAAAEGSWLRLATYEILRCEEGGNNLYPMSWPELPEEARDFTRRMVLLHRVRMVDGNMEFCRRVRAMEWGE